MKYAAKTTVTVEQTRNEIERTLKRYGADRFMYGWENSAAVVMFEISNRRVRFTLPLPPKSEFELTANYRQRRSTTAVEAAWEQACRQRWRALALSIKAKLETVESGIATFEEEFLARIVLPDNSTVWQFMHPQIETAYQQGDMPRMLPGIGETGREN
jgi:hypothetical protein